MDMRKFNFVNDAGIASGQAYLSSELEKLDIKIREPLTNISYAENVPIVVGGGWADHVAAMNVELGAVGDADDSDVGSGNANGIPVIQANFNKALFKTHLFERALVVKWVELQRADYCNRNLEEMLQKGVRLSYDKHMDRNAYIGIKGTGMKGLVNSDNITITSASATGTSGSTSWKNKTADQILEDINLAIQTVWDACGNDKKAVPNHILLPYEQYNLISTKKVAVDGENKTILSFLLDNNVAKNEGVSLVIKGCTWLKGAGDDNTDRMIVYVNDEYFLSINELQPLTKALTSVNARNMSYDTSYVANISSLILNIEQSLLYVDGI